MKKLLLVFTLVFTLLFGANRNPVFGKNGMVVSTSSQASEAGIEIMKKGGNAVDAAVVTGFALAVTSSSNGNIGGGVLWLPIWRTGLLLPWIIEK